MRRYSGRPLPGPTPRAEPPLLRATLGLAKLLSPAEPAAAGALVARRYRTAPLCVTSNSAVLFARDEWDGGREVVLKVVEGEAGADEARRWALLEQLDPRGVAPIVRLRHRLAVPAPRAPPRTVLVFARLTPMPALLARVQSLADVAAVARQVGAALAFLHQRRVVHADVKLENVLAADGAGWDVRLGDFGSAVWPGERAAPDQVGTLTHRAPELLLRHEAAVGAASDVWAWGCVVLELYSRAPLFPHPHEARLTRPDAEEHVLAQIRGMCGPLPPALAAAPDAARHRWLFAPGGEPARLAHAVKHVELAALLEALLAPDPAVRATALAALQMPVFAAHGALRLLLSAAAYPPAHPSSALPLPPAAPLLFAPLPADAAAAGRASAIVANHAPLPSAAQPLLRPVPRDTAPPKPALPAAQPSFPTPSPSPTSAAPSPVAAAAPPAPAAPRAPRSPPRDVKPVIARAPAPMPHTAVVHSTHPHASSGPLSVSVSVSVSSLAASASARPAPAPTKRAQHGGAAPAAKVARSEGEADDDVLLL